MKVWDRYWSKLPVFQLVYFKDSTLLPHYQVSPRSPGKLSWILRTAQRKAAGKPCLCEAWSASPGQGCGGSLWGEAGDTHCRAVPAPPGSARELQGQRWRDVPWVKQSFCWRLRCGELISKPFMFCARQCKYFTGLLKVLRVCFTLSRQGTLIFWEDFFSAQSPEFHIERLSVRAVTLIFQLPKLRQSIKKCSSISNWCLTVYFM